MYIEDNKLVITESKTFHFDLPIDVDKNLKHEIYNKTQRIFKRTKNRKWD